MRSMSPEPVLSKNKNGNSRAIYRMDLDLADEENDVQFQREEERRKGV